MLEAGSPDGISDGLWRFKTGFVKDRQMKAVCVTVFSRGRTIASVGPFIHGFNSLKNSRDLPEIERSAGTSDAETEALRDVLRAYSGRSPVGKPGFPRSDCR